MASVQSIAIICCLLLGVLCDSEPAIRQKRAVGVLTDELKSAIVAQHNEYRANESASDMKMMTWDDDLAVTAQNWVDGCRILVHSKAAGLGENIYASFGRTFEDNVARFTAAWWGEIADYDYDTLECASGKECGHYTQVVWADSYKVGCGIQDCVLSNGQTWTVVVCNYTPQGNFNGRAPFNNIGGPCTDCEAGDYCYEGLCANVARDGKDFRVTATMPDPQPPTTTTQAAVPATTTTQAAVPATTMTQAAVPATTTTQAAVPATTMTQAAVPATTTAQATVPATTTTQAAVPATTMTQAAGPATTTAQATVTPVTVSQGGTPRTTTASQAPTNAGGPATTTRPQVTTSTQPGPTDGGQGQGTTAGTRYPGTNKPTTPTPNRNCDVDMQEYIELFQDWKTAFEEYKDQYGDAYENCLQ